MATDGHWPLDGSMLILRHLSYRRFPTTAHCKHFLLSADVFPYVTALHHNQRITQIDTVAPRHVARPLQPIRTIDTTPVAAPPARCMCSSIGEHLKLRLSTVMAAAAGRAVHAQMSASSGTSSDGNSVSTRPGHDNISRPRTDWQLGRLLGSAFRRES